MPILTFCMGVDLFFISLLMVKKNTDVRNGPIQLYFYFMGLLRCQFGWFNEDALTAPNLPS